MRLLSSFLLLALTTTACTDAKLEPVVAPDFGPADGKADSAHSPASIELVELGAVSRATFTRRSQYRAFTFAATRGQRIDAFVDGLDGLDTVLLLYRATAPSATAPYSRPYGRAIAVNDDTDKPTWTLGGNDEPNPWSSSLANFELWDTRHYAVVATTYYGDSGQADVQIRLSRQTDAAILDAAKLHAWGTTEEGTDEDGNIRMVFASEADANQFVSEHGGVRWLAHDGEAPNALRFVAGSNDLWSQRFDVDMSTLAITITAEH